MDNWKVLEKATLYIDWKKFMHLNYLFEYSHVKQIQKRSESGRHLYRKNRIGEINNHFKNSL